MIRWRLSASDRLKGLLCLALPLFALAGCAAKPSPQPAALGWGGRLAPECKLEGCCEGHGKVAYVQPDRNIMCTDGTSSQICDCH